MAQAGLQNALSVRAKISIEPSRTKVVARQEGLEWVEVDAGGDSIRPNW